MLLQFFQSSMWQNISDISLLSLILDLKICLVLFPPQSILLASQAGTFDIGMGGWVKQVIPPGSL